MHQLRVLGFAEQNAAIFNIDYASPRSYVSEAFLFRNGINPLLIDSGSSTTKLTLLVPSLGGYYTSHRFGFACSFKCDDDIILGRDWLSECRPLVGHNALGHPSEQTTQTLPDNQRWTADGTSQWITHGGFLLTVVADTFLPFSLLHERAGQYRFAGAPGLQSTGGSTSVSPTFPGYSEQAFFDAACNRIFAKIPPFRGGNVTQCDEIFDPVYFRDAIFDFIHLCHTNEHWLFYSQAVADHAVTPQVGTSDGARAALLQHLFSGGCVTGQGAQCKRFVHGERWPQSMAIKMVDFTSEWVDTGKLTMTELSQICATLGLIASVTNQKRSLMSKLAAHRRCLVNALDVAKLPVQDTIHNVASSSTLETVRATCAAHDLPSSAGADKEGLVDAFIAHVAHGKCVEHHSPGCDQFTKETHLTTTDLVNMRVGILTQMKELLTTRQLQKVLGLCGIGYDPNDTKRKLKLLLKHYIQRIDKGKVNEGDAERSRVEQLQKLEEIRRNWPKLVPPQVKEKLIKDFRDATSSQALATFTCACCAREVLTKDRQKKAHTEVNIELLSSPPVHWNDDGTSAPPTPFTDGPLANKLLDVNGVESTDGLTYHLNLCTSCLKSLQRNVLPKHALANRLYVGPVPSALRDLTMVEECMIARARAKSWIVKLQETDAETSSPTSQRGLKGHTIIYPQDPGKLATVLPPPIEETLMFICVIFVGSSTLTKEWLRTKAKPLLVRREKVYNALVWLKEHNPLYKDIEIGLTNLDSLPVSDVLPYHIEHVCVDDAQEALTARYDNVDGTPEVAAAETQFESVVVADVEAHAPAGQLAAAAVRHAKTKGKPFVRVGHESHPVNEFFNTDLFPMLYPTLFPYGCGGFEDAGRRKPISLKEHVKYLFSLKDRRFQTHYSFLFIVFNILQRRALLLHASLKVKKSYFARFARDFSNVSSDAVAKILQQIEKGERVKAQTDEERRILRLMKEVNLVTAKVPGSSASRVAMRNEIRALTITHGMPSFYVTINPADTHNPVVKFLAGADIDIDKMLEDDVPKYWEQSVLVSSNPAIAAKFFNIYLKAFLAVVLGWSDGGARPEGGILGAVKAHYGCVEAQGRGSLHCHMLIWIEGALNPNEIREKVIQDEQWGLRLLEYLDDTITNVIPADPMPDVQGAFDNKHPCSLRGADLDIEDVSLRLALRMKDMHRLAERVQRHRHTHTCYKHYKPGEARTCRFDLKEENFRPESCVDTETGKVCLRCLDGLVNNFNMTMLEAVRCNMDIQFIGSGESAKAMIYYITDYITKSQLKTHVAYAALQLAISKCERVDDADDDFTVKSKRLLQKCAYALISHQEMSAQQVASYLMQYEDHFTSHEFSNVYWASFERCVDRDEPMKRRDQDTAEEGEACEDVNVSDNEDDEHNDEGHSRSDDETPGVCDRNESPDIEDEDEVAISIGDDGAVKERADQVCDYTCRPRELSGYCLWDFVAKTVKISSRRGRSKPMEEESENDDDEDENDGQSEEGCDTSGREAGDGGLRGRKPGEKYQFLDGHKESDRKYVRMRLCDVVPVPIGPALPRRDQPELYERYCRLMLILFKPWREPRDLRAHDEEWEHAYRGFASTMPRNHMDAIDNMQVLHECRDARDDHMQTRTRERLSPGKGGLCEEGGTAGNEMEEVDMSEVLEHLGKMERMSSNKLELMKHETHLCLQELERAGWYNVDEKARSGLGGAREQVLELPEDANVEDMWKDTYEKRRMAWKREAKCADTPGESCAAVGISTFMEIEMEQDDITRIDDVGGTEEAHSGGLDAEESIGQVVQKWTLNKEQKRAFEIVAQHTATENPDQLLMYVGGPGGTGKSRVVNALRDFFELRGQSRRFRLAAYTGVAARNVGGATLHALLQLNESGREVSAKTKREVAAMWDGVDYLFIDEVSMIGCEMLHNISSALTQAKGNTKAFGGVNVIFAGDFAQLPPIGDARLYKNMDVSKASAGATNRAQKKILGKLLWLSVETVVMLQETMRQAGSQNAQFVGILQRLRSGLCTPADHALLRRRLLGNIQLSLDEAWQRAPVIVANNATRDAINVRASKAFSDRTGKELHWYHARDTHKRKVVKDAELIECLEAQHSGQTKHRMRRIPLVIGMPVAVNQNFDVNAGVVNGSCGYLRAVRYNADRAGSRYLDSCVVEIPGADAGEMVHLPAKHYPILPDVTEIRFENRASHKRCTINRKQVPVEPGFAITAHKAQGQTMDKVVVDLASCSGTEQPYVMVSRCTTLEGLVILRDFDIAKITRRPSEELRDEFARLEQLRLQTIMNYGDDEEVEEAEELLGTSCGSKRKRGRKSKNVEKATQKRRKVRQEA